MNNKDTITLFALLTLFTLVLFTTTYRPPQKTPLTTITNLKSMFTTTNTLSIEAETIYSVTILVNNSITVPVTVSWGDSRVLYYNTSHTITINKSAVIYDGTTTTLPDVDVNIILIGDLRAMCKNGEGTITGSASFWPEIFLKLMGYTTAYMTAVDPCRNMYLVTAK